MPAFHVNEGDNPSVEPLSTSCWDWYICMNVLNHGVPTIVKTAERKLVKQSSVPVIWNSNRFAVPVVRNSNRFPVPVIWNSDRLTGLLCQFYETATGLLCQSYGPGSGSVIVWLIVQLYGYC